MLQAEQETSTSIIDSEFYFSANSKVDSDEAYEFEKPNNSFQNCQLVFYNGCNEQLLNQSIFTKMENSNQGHSFNQQMPVELTCYYSPHYPSENMKEFASSQKVNQLSNFEENQNVTVDSSLSPKFDNAYETEEIGSTSSDTSQTKTHNTHFYDNQNIKLNLQEDLCCEISPQKISVMSLSGIAENFMLQKHFNVNAPAGFKRPEKPTTDNSEFIDSQAFDEYESKGFQIQFSKSDSQTQLQEKSGSPTNSTLKFKKQCKNWLSSSLQHACRVSKAISSKSQFSSLKARNAVNESLQNMGINVGIVSEILGFKTDSLPISDASETNVADVKYKISDEFKNDECSFNSSNTVGMYRPQNAEIGISSAKAERIAKKNGFQRFSESLKSWNAFSCFTWVNFAFFIFNMIIGATNMALLSIHVTIFALALRILKKFSVAFLFGVSLLYQIAASFARLSNTNLIGLFATFGIFQSIWVLTFAVYTVFLSVSWSRSSVLWKKKLLPLFFYFPTAWEVYTFLNGMHLCFAIVSVAFGNLASGIVSLIFVAFAAVLYFAVNAKIIHILHAINLITLFTTLSITVGSRVTSASGICKSSCAIAASQIPFVLLQSIFACSIFYFYWRGNQAPIRTWKDMSSNILKFDNDKDGFKTSFEKTIWNGSAVSKVVLFQFKNSPKLDAVRPKDSTQYPTTKSPTFKNKNTAVTHTHNTNFIQYLSQPLECSQNQKNFLHEFETIDERISQRSSPSCSSIKWNRNSQQSVISPLNLDVQVGTFEIQSDSERLQSKTTEHAFQHDRANTEDYFSSRGTSGRCAENEEFKVNSYTSDKSETKSWLPSLLGEPSPKFELFYEISGSKDADEKLQKDQVSQQNAGIDNNNNNNNEQQGLEDFVIFSKQESGCA